jgi:hypothetical protein
MLAVALLALPAALAASSHPQVETVFETVRAECSGERALETVAFTERHWRWPGNRGFDATIQHVAELLAAAGYADEAEAETESRLTYRLERRPMSRPAWEPVRGTLRIAGDDEPLLTYDSNRNMIAINSVSTPAGGVEAEIVDVGRARRGDLDGVDLRGRILMGRAHPSTLHRLARAGGAVGVLSYSIPGYNRAETHTGSIPFSSIRRDGDLFGIMLSHGVYTTLRERLEDGPVRVHVDIETRSYEAEELTLVADVRGRDHHDQRLVFSAHVQEPGANDNGSGVGVQAEMARALAAMIERGDADPRRTITFIWGDEITATRRYLRDDAKRAEGVRWGISLDMVGADPEKTGGTFLIEKMPDPSAIWTRGEDKHTEWGRPRLSADELTPHYFNDFIIGRCREQAAVSGWVVGTNPYEGGSDHVPFLRADKPGLLLWHFTDVFYHTDGDRLVNISPFTMENVAVSALASALVLVDADASVASFVIGETKAAALKRLDAEAKLSRVTLDAGGDVATERTILQAWIDWYAGALRSCEDIEPMGPSPATRDAIAAAVAEVSERGAKILADLGR